MYHEKSAIPLNCVEITVRSDSIRDNLILIVNNVPSSALSSKPQTANKLELNAFSNLVVKRYVSFFHA